MIMRFNKQSKINELITESIKKLENSIQSTQIELHNLKAILPEALIIVSSLSSSLKIFKNDMHDVRYDWERGVISNKLLQHFNMSFECDKNCPLELAKPKSCYIDTHRKHLMFDFSLQNVNTNLIIMKADPFTLLNENFDKSKICIFDYQGPSAVVDDTVNKCLTPLPYYSGIGENLILMPKDQCITYGTEESYDAYNLNKCVDKKQLDPTTFIQVKNTQNTNFVYCRYNKIIIHDEEFNCPNFVFGIPPNVPFSIGALHYTASIMRKESSLTFIPEKSHQLNIKLLRFTQPIVELKSLEEAVEDLKMHKIPPKVVHIETVPLWITITMIIVITLLVVCAFLNAINIWCRLRRQRPNDVSLRDLVTALRERRTPLEESL